MNVSTVHTVFSSAHPTRLRRTLSWRSEGTKVHFRPKRQVPSWKNLNPRELSMRFFPASALTDVLAPLEHLLDDSQAQRVIVHDENPETRRELRRSVRWEVRPVDLLQRHVGHFFCPWKLGRGSGFHVAGREKKSEKPAQLPTPLSTRVRLRPTRALLGMVARTAKDKSPLSPRRLRARLYPRVAVPRFL